ncbi:NACHT domain-containing protein [Streptomyces sp. NPDC059080]|uniref:NACHT domain-containing protein n=1 Tax=Streptomyces sp. NPDC059080 TaxID=3346718 RepID=UPI0036B28F92
MRRPSSVRTALGKIVPVVLVLASGAATGGGLVPGGYAPWARGVVIGLATAVVIVGVHRLRSGGGRTLRAGSTYNTVSDSTTGSVVQAGKIGQVNIGVRAPPRLKDTVDDAAQRLAESVRKQWLCEEEQRRTQDPIPLPVRWQSAPDDLTDHWSNICRSQDGAVSRPPALAGRLDEIADVYLRIPSGRLVVLGRAGSGKSVLAMRFVLDLLGPPTASVSLVPVIFSLGSWNPATPLRAWLVSQLERDHPGLAEPGPDGPTLAAALVHGNRILPVLDGFDEIADGLHRGALDKLNDFTRPLLLTSRRAEYAAAVPCTRVLTSAACIELANLSLTDLESYLPRTTTRKAASEGKDTGTTRATVWSPVLKHLRDRPLHPASIQLSTVLTTPLMVALVRTIYSDTSDRDPSALLDTDRFSTPDALEDHLLDNFVSTVYRDQPPALRERIPHRLGYLAQHLNQLGTRDLAWWQLGSTLRRSSRMRVIGLLTGLAFGLVDGLFMCFMNWLWFGSGLWNGLVNGLVNGLAFGSASGLVFALVYGLRYGDAAGEPSRVRVRLLGSPKEIRRKFVPRLVVGLVGGFGFTFLATAVSTVVAGLASGAQPGFMAWLDVGLQQGLLGALGIGPIAGLVYALMAGLEAPIDIETAVSPSELLSTNRTTVLFQLFVFGLAVGAAGGILCLMQRARIVDWIAIAVVGGLGGGLAYGLSLTAWGQWVALSRIWLPLTGRLPWAVSAFLKDAHRRGVLRQAGAVYQFRHARLQDHLTRAFRTPP